MQWENQVGPKSGAIKVLDRAFPTPTHVLFGE